MEYKYNPEKNSILLAERGIGFNEIIQAIADGNVLGIRDHSNQKKYPHQKVLFVRIVDEVYAVPFVFEDDNTLFLKTLYPSRKARKEFLAF